METIALRSTPTRAVSLFPGTSRGRRALDLLGCLVALPLLGVTALAMTVITSLRSPGPVIFRQRRIGHGGREFMILKFRTMRVGADAGIHQQHFKALVDTKSPMVKLDARQDARLLPGGWLLRATGLDELPQIINVLRGEMSLVGPRPCLPCEYAHYQPEQRTRFDVLPGLTGLWQVSGKNRTTFEEMIQLDLRYVRNRSLLLNLKIILLTPGTLLGQIIEAQRRNRSSAEASSTRRPVFSSANTRLSKPF